MIARILALLLLMTPALAQTTIHYTATNVNVKYLFATAEPVAHLKSGDILDTNTLDCFGNVLRKPGDTLSMVKGDNPLTGPFFVEGAEPGDTLAVKILDLQVDGDTGVGAFAPAFGALNETNYTPMLHPPLLERIWYYHIRSRRQHCHVQGARHRFLRQNSSASFLWLYRRLARRG
ncbi:MAG: acetamidase/formamidase family protein [Candidatus Sulfotelmatobacter sp.]